MINELHPKVIPEPNSGCWIWLGSFSHGYGRIQLDRVWEYVHRLSYLQHKGYLPLNLELDHTCRNKLCCNPAHLEIVTHKENMLRHHSKQKTCQQGHELSGENLICLPGKRSAQRRCKICHRQRMMKYRHAASRH